MKKAILALAMSATFVSCGASATGKFDITNPFDHATRPELASAVKTLNAADAKETAARIDGDKNLQSQVTQHGYEINTQAKYTTSVNNDLQNSKAQGAAAYNELKGTQGQQQTQINAVQGAAVNAQQTANTAVGIGQDAKNTAVNAQNTANYAVGQGQKNANDIVNVSHVASNAYNNAAVAQQGVNTNAAAIKATNGVVAGHTTQINNLSTVSNQHTTQISNLDSRTTSNTTNITKNTSDIKATNVAVGQHTTQLANHETRITGTEKTVASQGVTLNQHTEALQQNAAQWQVQGKVNNEYGQRLDAQDAMSSRFAGDIGNLKSQVAGMNDRINSADRKAEKALNAAAGALSVASIQFNTDVEAGFQVGAGVATLAGKNAAAVGVGGAINNQWFVSGYATQAGSASGAAASVTYSMGR